MSSSVSSREEEIGQAMGDDLKSSTTSDVSILFKKGVMAANFREDVKMHRPFFVKSLKKIGPKIKYYFGPYEQKGVDFREVNAAAKLRQIPTKQTRLQ